MSTIFLAFILSVTFITFFIYLQPKKFLEIAIKLSRKQAGLKAGSVTIKNSLCIAYLEGGHGKTIVMLHGFGGNKDIFVNFAKRLIKTNRVIIPDIIGFGDSSHPKDVDYSSLAQAGRINQLLKELEVDSCHLLGNSMGAQIAVTYAHSFPEKVKSLCLVSPSGVWTPPQSKIIEEIIKGESNPLIAHTVQEFSKILSIGMKKPPFLPKVLRDILAQERISNALLEEAIFNALLQDNIEEKVQEIDIPILVLYGKEDTIISSESFAYLKQLQSSIQMACIPDCAHVATYEKPKKSAEIYLHFLGVSS